MIVEIEDELFSKVLKIVKQRNITIYNQIKDIQPITSLNKNDTLATARTVKTERIKESIRATLRELMQSNINPSKYKVHKHTKIAYVTLGKYYDEILNEVQNEKQINNA